MPLAHRDPRRARLWWLALPLLLGLAHAAPVLDAFGESLSRLPPAQRAQLLANAARWDAWTAAEREQFRRRVAAWSLLPPAGRARRREHFAAWQRLTPAERAQVRAMAARWQQLDATQQQAWRARFALQDSVGQRGWWLGPELGRDYPRMQPLLAQVPPAEHGPLLGVLRELTPAQRDELAVLVQRTPPQERAQLRRELLSTAAHARQAWLWRRLDR